MREPVVDLVRKLARRIGRMTTRHLQELRRLRAAAARNEELRAELARQNLELRSQLDALRSSLEVNPCFIEEFERTRRTDEYQAVFERRDPLVTVCMGTYNRARLLTERALPSILAQDHENLEVLVVGDCCTDDTADRVAALGDSRVHFVNLPLHGPYPEDEHRHWQVAGTMPFNHALERARGDFVTHLDDDDEYLPRRISSLVRLAQAERADLVFHPFWTETLPGSWVLNGAEHFSLGRVTTSAVLYHRWLARISWSVAAWRTDEPGDWHRFRRLAYVGARTVRHPEPLVRHYRERKSPAEA